MLDEAPERYEHYEDGDDAFGVPVEIPSLESLTAEWEIFHSTEVGRTTTLEQFRLRKVAMAIAWAEGRHGRAVIDDYEDARNRCARMERREQ